MARPVAVYAVLDCARHLSAYNLVQRSYRDKACLFAGTIDPVLLQAAPHLIQLESRDNVTDELLSQGWADSWAILLRVDAPFNTVRRHLRTFLRVTDDNRSNLLFRYYDPRVLRRFLPTCSPRQLATLFALDGLHYIVPASDPGEALDYSCEDRTTLKLSRFSLDANSFSTTVYEAASL